MNEPRSIPIHRSLNRPHLMLGAERGLVLMCGLGTALIIFSGGISIAGLAFGAFFWTTSFWSIVQMAKADTQMSMVYQRHIRYKSHYNAKGCLNAMLSPLPKSKG